MFVATANEISAETAPWSQVILLGHHGKKVSFARQGSQKIQEINLGTCVFERNNANSTLFFQVEGTRAAVTKGIHKSFVMQPFASFVSLHILKNMFII